MTMADQDRALLAEARRYGFIQDQEVWLHAIPALGHPARRVGAVRTTDDDALLYFARRYEAQYRAKVDDVLRRYEATEDNKNAFLVKVLHLKELTGSYDALGDYLAQYQRLGDLEAEINGSIGRNREKNLATRLQLIEQAETIQHSMLWNEVSAQFKSLRDAWVKTGAVDKTLTDVLEARFQHALETFHQRKKDFYKEKHTLQQRAKDRYKSLINESNRLKESSDWEATTRRLKQIQLDWKDVGGGLSRKLANEMWMRLRAAHNYYFERLQKHIAEQRVLNPTPSPDDILERKRELVRQAGLLLDAPAHDAIPATKELQNKWKVSGTVRGPESDRVWEAFVVACDKVFEQSALEHYVRKQNPEINDEPPLTQGKIRLAALREFLANDEIELTALRTNLEALADTPTNEAARTTLIGKMRALGRKIRSKTELQDLVRERYEL
ncbi:MAG: DUF349 domain-containing protein [Hymenobacteraceae bacterium]|nr:DUF349 domain-containing protein [Hymenobacteraceae bacterium]